jgi:glycerol-3-phosphate O-acyltransferase/dihydroxyacetone phosphate acyltransferase
MSYAVGKYFVEVNILNEDRIPKDKPVLLLPNHRSAFMDPVVVASQLKGSIYFLARGESFNNPFVVRVFKRLKMIPIFRKEYSPEKTHQNEDVFKHCHELMKEKGTLMIFPEGICQTKFLLAPLKVGSARIALEAEDKNNFELDVHLIPIGINYTNPHRFRGMVTVNIGTPIKAADYKEAYEQDKWQVVNDLTSDLEKELKEQIIVLEDQSEIEVIAQIENLLLDQPTVLEAQDWYGRRKEINELVRRFKQKDISSYSSFKTRLHLYFGSLDRLGLKYRNEGIKTGLHITNNNIIKTFLLIFGFPFFTFGSILHFLPFFITIISAKSFVKRVDFMGSILLIFGLLIFSIFGFVEAWLLHRLIGNIYITLGFIIAWPTLGLFTYGYLSEGVKWMDKLKWMQLSIRRKELKETLSQNKLNLIEELSHQKSIQ